MSSPSPACCTTKAAGSASLFTSRVSDSTAASEVHTSTLERDSWGYKLPVATRMASMVPLQTNQFSPLSRLLARNLTTFGLATSLFDVKMTAALGQGLEASQWPTSATLLTGSPSIPGFPSLSPGTQFPIAKCQSHRHGMQVLSSSRQGIQINGDQQIKDESERYTIVAVPASHAIRGLITKRQGDVSPISERIGRPLRLIMRPTQLCYLDADGRMPTCSPAASLMRSLDKDTNEHLPQIALGLPRSGLRSVDQALVVRTDDKDLSVDDVRRWRTFPSPCAAKYSGASRLYIGRTSQAWMMPCRRRWIS